MRGQGIGYMVYYSSLKDAFREIYPMLIRVLLWVAGTNPLEHIDPNKLKSI
jgi:hypothetical protein